MRRSAEVLRAAVVGLAVATLVPSSAARADLEKDLARTWEGSWVLTRIDTRSACTGFFTDNPVAGGAARPRSGAPFGPGELGQVAGVDLHRASVDVKIAFAEPLLVPYQEGPFTLYREASCKIELEVEVDREVVREERVEALDARLGELLARFASRADAVASEQWNRRERDPYPPDYERTLAEHRTWQAEQANLAVQTRIDEAIERLSRLPALVERDPAWLDGFAAGVAARRRVYLPDCPALIDLTFSPETGKAPADFADDAEAWKRGYRDGQLHAHELAVLERLPGCFVPVPPPVP